MASHEFPFARPLWTREALHSLIEQQLPNVKFIVVSNREPYIHRWRDGGIECILPASGMATALDPIMQASGGVWIAHGSGDADREVVNERDHVAVPPGRPSYTLRRVWLDEQLERDYYYGLSNNGMWPLCHIAFHRPVFRLNEWQAYERANRIFADAILQEAAGQPAFVFIQDYHFGLLPRMLKDANPSLFVAQFWHIPWPNRETFRVFPWKEQLLDGMLGNDLLGFHLRYHCMNFLDTVDRNIEAMVDNEHSNIIRGRHQTMIRPFPISIDFEGHSTDAAGYVAEREMNDWIDRIGYEPDCCVGAGIDRIDYTKGIPERLAAIDLFLETHPDYVGKFLFVQVGVPSRSALESYSGLAAEIERQVEALNTKWQRDDWRPVHYHKGHCGQSTLMGLHRLANFCLVSSLHDGMNLVAKEYVASRYDEQGILILSQFTGSARELNDAIHVNPFSVDEMAGAIYRALTMTPDEQRRRMHRLRRTVLDNNIYRWAGKILSTLLKFELPERREVEEQVEVIAG